MKKYQIILLLFLTFTQVSCFEIVEQISLNNNGSGTLKYTLNFSQSATKIKSLLLLDEVEGYKVPTQNIIKHKFNLIGNIAKQVNGISAVKTNSNFEDYIFTFTCNFSKIENLNTLIDSISSKKFPNSNYTANYFKYNIKNQTYSRKGDDILKNYYLKLPEKQRAIFNGATYTSVTKFDTEVSSFFQKKALLSKSKKAILHKLSIIELIKNGTIINQKIVLKK